LIQRFIGEALEPYVGTGKHDRKLPAFGGYDHPREYHDTKYMKGEKDVYIGIDTNGGTLYDQSPGVDYLLCGQIGQPFWRKRSDGTLDLPDISTQATSRPYYGLGLAEYLPSHLYNIENQDDAIPEHDLSNEAYETNKISDAFRPDVETDPVLPLMPKNDGPVANDFLRTAYKIKRSSISNVKNKR